MNSAVTSGVFQPLEADDPPVIGGYRLAARLGAGGMGRVYLSYTPGGRPVAIKVIRAEFGEDPDFRRRFQREVRAAERVQGLYTAPVLDSDTEGPQPWLATAYVAGPSLAEAVTRHGPLPAPTVLRLIAGIAEALQVIHAAGLVHRDLKPSNVLLSVDGPRVIDFGIARAVEGTTLTHSGVVVGTPSFMSPEQAAGGRVGTATDVFALGQLGAFAASGAPAFGEGTSHAVLYRVVHEHPDLSRLPDPLRNLIAHCLAKDPAARPAVAAIIAAVDEIAPPPPPGQWLPAELAAALPGPGAPLPLPPTAPDPGNARGGRRPRRGVVVAAAGATAALLLAAGLVVVALGGDDETPDAGSPPPAGDGTATSEPAATGEPEPEPEPEDDPSPDESTTQTLDAPTPEETATGSAPPDTEPDPEPEAAQYPGIDLPYGYHVFFGSDPLTPIQSNADNRTEVDFRYYDGLVRTAEGNTLVLLDGTGNGSLATCRAETRFTDRIALTHLAEGSQICVRTAAGHIGLITITGLPTADGPSDYLAIDATVWRDAP
ncbi:serine/threonine-protein kinase [Streptomyces litchfieldiae]|uniref:Serine/threonine-protein kinase n=1 Tax=Streptomyces litchfieldiae TaxID=3075543 RepID=A0ABU2MW26_9ACTN|nr:serine/threonine-protein kinase [Streptomyces sp. DSM 44938]MDT0344769.1 serine/threonine-protein kinase [Streptomyces sp. DSM 44938]